MNKYKKIAQLILVDLRGRSGFDVDLDDDTIEEILEEWAKIIREHA